MGKKDLFNAPFAEVGKALKKDLAKKRKAALEPPPKRAAPPAAPAPPETDDALFLRATSDTRRVGADPRGKARTPPPPRAEDVPVYDEDAEVLAQLASLIEGSAHFDISDSDEFIEGGIEGLDRRILRSLRRGDYAVHGHLDLHGMTREPAKDAVEAFLTEARRKSWRCVVIVHGRGHHSKDNIPVLKGLLKSWLERGRIARNILAFCTAQPHDGGAGAMYVLLRR